MDAATLKAEFERLGPWITQYHIDGETYGGFFDALNDARVTQFFEVFPQAQTILELGSLEGGHSLALARHPGVQRVVALEAREPNLARARFIQSVYGDQIVEFVQANLEDCDLGQWGRFDAIFCSGLLYHLPEPWTLLAQFPAVSANLYMSTHYAFDNEASVTRNGYQGKLYQEFGVADPLSGMSDQSFWPTLAELERMIKDCGYTQVDVLVTNTEHPNGGIVNLKASVK